jgi:hypothetical protein
MKIVCVIKYRGKYLLISKKEYENYRYNFPFFYSDNNENLYDKIINDIYIKTFLSISKESIVEYKNDSKNECMTRYFHISINFSYIISKDYNYKWLSIRQIKKGKFSRTEKKWIKDRIYIQQKSLIEEKKIVKLHEKLREIQVLSKKINEYINIDENEDKNNLVMSVIDFLELNRCDIHDEKFEKTYFYPVVESVINWIM